MEPAQCADGGASPKRNYGIDALRLFAMYMVCMLHTLGQGGILSASAKGTIGYKAFWLIEIISFCAVDCFAIISGYTATDKPRRFSRIVEMWFQAFFYSFVITVLLSCVIQSVDLPIFEMIKCALPLVFGKFWYFSAYFALFLAIPVLNRFVFSVDDNTAKKALIIAVLLYSVIGFVTDTFSMVGGSSALWLMVVYCIGALAKRVKLFEARSNWFLLALGSVSVLFTWFLYVYFGFGSFIDYLSPTILLNAIILVTLFSRLRIKGKIISKLAPLAFGIYLFQLNQVIWNNCLYGAFSFVARKSLPVGVLYAIVLALCIWCVGLLVDFLRAQIFRLLHISSLSTRVGNWADKGITKLFVLLK